MKGLALSVVWGLVITIASVIFFLMLVTGTFKRAANWFYCDIYLKVIGFFTGREIASIPEMCRNMGRDYSVEVEIKETDNKIVSRRILALIITCWNEAELKGLYETHPCYEVKLPGNIENVSENNISLILNEEDHCKSIENSDYDCGAHDQIIWNVDGGVINTQRLMLIEYNGPKDAVEVIG